MEVDLGCGDGSFLAALAARDPERNFLGLERLAGRVRSSSGGIERRALANARVLRGDIAHAVESLPASSVDVFHLMFPDPWPKRRHHVRRVFTGQFLQSIARALGSGGVLRMATDHREYFEQMLRVAAATPLFQAFTPLDDPPLPRSNFEERYLAAGDEIFRLALRKISGRM